MIDSEGKNDLLMCLWNFRRTLGHLQMMKKKR